MKKFYLIIAVLIVLVVIAVLAYQNAEETYELESTFVTKVIDGDTIVVGGGQSVRLIGIDTKERGEKCYQEAKQRMTELVGMKNITMERERENKDRYGRLLRHVYINNTWVNVQMIVDGLAIAYLQEPNSRYKTDFEDAEQKARERRGCVWAAQQ